MQSIDLLSETLNKEGLTDLLFDGCGAALAEINGQLVKVDNPFLDEESIQIWIKKLLGDWGARLDLAKPIAEITIPTEFGLLRIHAVLGGECSTRTQISIRRHSITKLTLSNLTTRKTIDDSQLVVLKQIISSRENFIIVGGTGCGKTTLLKAMLEEVAQERIITIEDAPELDLGGNAVSLITRSNNHEGVGRISLGALLREALRMRPDRIVIGEARGEELLVLLQALNTGHSGSGFSLHANNHGEVQSRMLTILSGAGVNHDFAKQLIRNSISWVIEVSRDNDARKVVAIKRMAEAFD
jgi:pilus assembly protein CpaF